VIQGILLAAGSSIRFGKNKLLWPLPDGIPMVVASARHLEAALPGSVAVVNGSEARLIALLEGTGLKVTVCPRAGEGMGASLAWGVSEVSAAEGWLIALADMPFIKPGTIRSVAHAVNGPQTISAPELEGRRGHPVAFGKFYGPALSRLSGDRGARDLVERHRERLVLVPCRDPGVLRDIDYQAQMADLPRHPV
jgi:molybdenum cofactor cytidylyltransferase